ncbi:alpha/beta hydrolase [Hamadaea sp. NPDC050747]|uniref:alpha/beta hydrolase n=1 Tax=Hamadaea sp. NPDC050747 TaxID=3155789 RepID=UPI0033FD3110
MAVILVAVGQVRDRPVAAQPASSPASPALLASSRLCQDKAVRCATVDSAGTTIGYAIVPGTSHQGLVLVEVGGPGSDALARDGRDSLGLPTSLDGYDVLLVDEPWTQQTATSQCSDARRRFAAAVTTGPATATGLLPACQLAAWTEDRYTAAITTILTREHRTLTGIIGHSFGALPATAAARAFDTAWLVLSAPIAPATVPGRQVIDERITTVYAAFDRSYASVCAPAGLDCHRTGQAVLQAAITRTTTLTVAGRTRPLTSADIGLAAVAAAYGMQSNQQWLWTTLARMPKVSDDAAVQLGRMADQLLMRYGDDSVSINLTGFVAGICASYRWGQPLPGPAGLPESLLAQTGRECAPVTAPGWQTTPMPARTGAVCVFTNTTDPVTPTSWATAWQQLIPAATITTYTYNGHTPLAMAVRQSPATVCPIKEMRHG